MKKKLRAIGDRSVSSKSSRLRKLKAEKQYFKKKWLKNFLKHGNKNLQTDGKHKCRAGKT